MRRCRCRHACPPWSPPAGAPRLNSEFSVWGLPGSTTTTPEAGGWPGAAYPPQGDESKWPLTAERNFERYKLAAVFEDLDNLAKLTQRRMTRGIRSLYYYDGTTSDPRLADVSSNQEQRKSP